MSMEIKNTFNKGVEMRTEERFANHAGYSDVNPYEIVRRVSNKTIEVRPMAAELDPEWKPEVVAGGFSGHCTNQHTQKWDIKSDESMPVSRIRLRKDGSWRDSGGRLFRLSAHPIKYYDYNF